CFCAHTDSSRTSRHVRKVPFASIWPRVDRFRSSPPKADMRTGVRSFTLTISVRAVPGLTVWMGGHQPATLTPFGKRREAERRKMDTRAKACLGVAVFVAYLSSNAATWAGELVRFESAPVHVGQLQQRLARELGKTPKAASETIEGYLSKPEGDGPFSAIVYLHGCDGLSEDARTYN